MPRARDPARLDRLIDAATEVFIAKGYGRAQMLDVAEALGVAKGTVYLYVESKEALFHLAVRAANDAPVAPDALPVPTPDAGATLRYVREHLGKESKLSRLEEALGRRSPTNVRQELAEIVRELFGLLHCRRIAIKLLERCAGDYPELAGIYFSVAREAVPALLEAYLRSRLSPEEVRGATHAALARGIIEIVAFWAIHRHWDPAPTRVTDEIAEETAVRLSLGALGS